MPFEEPRLGEQTQRMNYHQPSNWWQKTPFWAKVISISLVTGFTGMTFLLVSLRVLPLPDESLANPTRIDSAEGQPLAEWTLKGTHVQNVPLSKIPPSLQQATLAVEDVHFYDHHAFNPWSIARAVLVDVEHGHVVEGGSTITQQLAKNLFLNQDRTMMRKVKEALYAMQLELHESKQTIFTQYLNAIYYGHGAYGIGAAAQLYFNKPVEDLNLAESAMLAGLPKGPSLYSPLTHFSAAKERQRLVLDRMVKAGFLTPVEADKAYREPLRITTVHAPLVKAPYFTSSVVQEVENRFHLSSEDLYRGDISITTTLDPLLQQAAERAIETTLQGDSKLQAALVALDPQTGAIQAMVGGRDFDTSPYNRSYAQRQPGSSFKPILYAAALNDGWTPARQVMSEETTFIYDQLKQYTVHDYGNIYAHRPLTMREALARSDNVYAVTANLEIGPDKVVEMAHRLGLKESLQPYPSLALGVFPTSPLDMAAAYAVFANGGYKVSPYGVQEIRDARLGHVLQSKTEHEPVLSPQLTFQVTDLLTSVLKPNGTAYGVHQYLHGPAAVKTGTTNSDVWTVGYTPKLVCAVWVGYDDNRPLSLSESHMAAPIWAKFMGTAQQRMPSAWFTPPPGLVKRTIDPVTAKLATDTCSTTETDYFVSGTEPTENCPLHPASTPPERLKKSLFQWLSKWF